MAEGRSRADLLKFLDYMGRKGLIPANTASARKAAANKVLQILSDDEAEDVTSLDVDETVRRFGNKFRSDYTAESLQSYASRVRSSLDDFKRHCDDPLNFKVGRKSPHRPLRDRSVNARNEVTGSPQASPVRSTLAVQVLPIALRPDLIVHIAGLPHDLSKVEAQRLSNIILAHAVPDAS